MRNYIYIYIHTFSKLIETLNLNIVSAQGRDESLKRASNYEFAGGGFSGEEANDNQISLLRFISAAENANGFGARRILRRRGEGHSETLLRKVR